MLQRQFPQPGFNHLSSFGFLLCGRPTNEEPGLLLLGARMDDRFGDLLRRFRRRGLAVHDYEYPLPLSPCAGASTLPESSRSVCAGAPAFAVLRFELPQNKLNFWNRPLTARYCRTPTVCRFPGDVYFVPAAWSEMSRFLQMSCTNFGQAVCKSCRISFRLLGGLRSEPCSWRTCTMSSASR